MVKKCIFHVPNAINTKFQSGSQIRPLKMINAFKNIGYEVDIVMGYGKDRKKQIQEIKINIKNGVKYDFLYSESSTMPTLLTEKHHLPLYFNLDFNFFKFCKKKGIKIGLFYRDIYWKFPIYKLRVSKIKRVVAVRFYKYDLIQYKKTLDILYLPTKKVYDYMAFVFKGMIEELPPGFDKKQFLNEVKIYKDNSKLNVFYVGGVGDLHNVTFIIKAAYDLDFINLTICCKKEEWDQEKHKYKRYLNSRINIVHESGTELTKYYKQADILYLFIEPSEYRNMAMPIKLFEYIGSGKPILATNCSAADKFIEANGIGWNIEYSYDAIVEGLKYIYSNKREIKVKEKNIENIKTDHTWESRAKKVASQLSEN